MSFQKATWVQSIAPQTYAVELLGDWCIGSVPNGGYVGSVLLSAMRAHFTGPLAHLNQPDTMSMQLQFLRRTHAGPATITIEPLKLGNLTSSLQVTLTQDDRREVQGYIVQTNFSSLTGVTVPTTFLQTILQPLPPPIDFAKVERDGEDANWYLHKEPEGNTFRRAMKHVLFHHPKVKKDRAVVDQWIRFRPGGEGNEIVPFTQEALGFVVDIFPVLVEQFDEVRKEGHPMWFPTVALNLDVKKNLPAGGADWLYVRVRAGEIRNGRMDLQILVLDREGGIVAMSTHITLIVSAERNLAERRPGNGSTGAQEASGKL